ncbi:Hsp20/alpha crystallin family protein [Methanogenium marinum]|uniref:Hsp20/alpha crystallin family protein n=1 Tax=Methanogenium marinum TaxID=348610 RepID=A0A9Q4KT53_9EURY|nr:Hsp20/alpha crystallin family protein [Methanogenium marinum]MDE4907492.1 Hsp20/alpha crystallin family protein [Methanogenium marinum]
MAEEPDERINQYTELIRRLFEEAMKAGEMQPGEINIIIAAASLPKGMDLAEQGEMKKPVVREPVFERQEHQDSVTITADLPGTTPDDIRYTLQRGIIYLAARADGIIYRAAYPVEDAAENTLTQTYKNGVIEFTYKKQGQNIGNVHPGSGSSNDI